MFENFKRIITKDFRTIGRSFIAGDIVILTDDKMDHFYADSCKLGAILNFDCSTVNPDLIHRIEGNSELIGNKEFICS